MALRLVATATLLATALAVAHPADAKTVRIAKTVKAGASTKIDGYTGWKDDCSFLTLKIDVIENPSHGKVSPKVTQGRITNAQVGSTRSCLGKPTRVIDVYYRSDAGFRGKDSFTVLMRTPNAAPVTFVYSVTVR